MSDRRKAGVQRRAIEETDLEAVVALLRRGFPSRPESFWVEGLRRMAQRPSVPGAQKFGYMLCQGEVPVGSILMSTSLVPVQHGSVRRCNLAAWYVEPRYRNIGSLLVTSALKDSDTTYTNVTAAPHTWSTVAAQGFTPYCLGEMTTVPLLSRTHPSARIAPFDGANLDPGAADAQILADHATFVGCLSLVVDCEGERYPFVFQKQRHMKRLVPSFRLLYCRDIADYVRFAGNLGRYLASYGRFIVVIDADEPVPGLIGNHTNSRGRKFFRGPNKPRHGDLAYAEWCFFP
jgi:hypothetical protein